MRKKKHRENTSQHPCSLPLDLQTKPRNHNECILWVLGVFLHILMVLTNVQRFLMPILPSKSLEELWRNLFGNLVLWPFFFFFSWFVSNKKLSLKWHPFWTRKLINQQSVQTCAPLEAERKTFLHLKNQNDCCGFPWKCWLHLALSAAGFTQVFVEVAVFEPAPVINCCWVCGDIRYPVRPRSASR